MTHLWPFALFLTLSLTLSLPLAGGCAPPDPSGDDDAGTPAGDDGGAPPAPVDDGGAPPDPDGGTPAPEPEPAPGDAGPLPTDAGPSPEPPPADAGPPPVLGDPGATGPYSFDFVDDSIARGGRTTPTRTYVPTGAGPFALLVFVPGLSVDSVYYTPLFERLASHGFIVVASDPVDNIFVPPLNHVAMAEDVSAVIDTALDDTTLAIDPVRIGAFGHSLGGKVSLMAAVRDARIGAVFTIDPVDGAGQATVNASRPDISPAEVQGLAIPLGFLGETTNGTGDGFLQPACAPVGENFRAFYADATSAPIAYQMDVLDADHMDFVEDPSCPTCGTCEEGTADPAAVRAATRKLATAFFRRHFGDEAAMDDVLDGPETPDGVDVDVKTN